MGFGDLGPRLLEHAAEMLSEPDDVRVHPCCHLALVAQAENLLLGTMQPRLEAFPDLEEAIREMLLQNGLFLENELVCLVDELGQRVDAGHLVPPSHGS